jgi:FG-GAP repeat
MLFRPKAIELPACIHWLVAVVALVRTPWRWFALGATFGLASVLAGCGGASDGSSSDTSGGSNPGSALVTPTPAAPNTSAPTPSPTPTAPTSFSVGGVLVGLAPYQSLVLAATDTSGNNLQTATLNANGNYTVAQVPSGSVFLVSVQTQPMGQTCSVTNGSGTVNANINGVRVHCADNRYTVGGSIGNNLGVVSLRNSVNADVFTTNAEGTFSFSQTILHGSAYNIVINDSSEGQSCTVMNASGTAAANVSNLLVNCVVVLPPPPATPTVLTVGYSAKQYAFSWNPTAGAAYYELAEDPDGVGAQPEVAIGGSITVASYNHTLTTLLHQRLNAYYRIRACNAGGCSAYSAALTPNLTQAVGYFKASNTRAGDSFGIALALSADGNTLAVGAFQEDSNAIGVGGNQGDNSLSNAGAVYVFVRSGGSWSQQAYLKASNTDANDSFGYSLSLSADGNTLAVGAGNEASNATGVGGNQADNSVSGAGAVYVFTRSSSNWTQQAYLKASNTGAGDHFGTSVALSADGNTLAVGSDGEASNATGVGGNQADNSLSAAGAVYVFTRGSGIWSQEAYIKASNTGAGDRFSTSVALSADGNTLAVGAERESSNATGVAGNQADNSAFRSGAAYVFTRSVGTWNQQAYIKASNTNTLDRFGNKLVLSGDGNTMAVAAWFEGSNATGVGGNEADNSAANSGAVYVFSRGAGIWSQRAYLKASNTAAADIFGSAVALSADGHTLAAAALAEASNATGVGGNQTDNSTASSGAVYVY